MKFNAGSKVVAVYEISAAREMYIVTIFRTPADVLYGEYLPLTQGANAPFRVYDLFSRPARDHEKEASEILARCIAEIGAKSGAISLVIKRQPAAGGAEGNP